MAGNFWVNGTLVPGVVVANDNIPTISGTTNPRHHGALYPVVYIVNPSG
tara:strand:- start:89 stop:235 length:147 start_codon:yes stop_codon:yes gene_type:complete